MKVDLHVELDSTNRREDDGVGGLVLRRAAMTPPSSEVAQAGKSVRSQTKVPEVRSVARLDWCRRGGRVRSSTERMILSSGRMRARGSST